MSGHRERAKDLLVRECVFTLSILSRAAISSPHLALRVCACVWGQLLCMQLSPQASTGMQAGSAPLAPFLRWSPVVPALLAVTDSQSVCTHFILALICNMANLRASSTSARQQQVIEGSVHVCVSACPRMCRIQLCTRLHAGRHAGGCWHGVGRYVPWVSMSVCVCVCACVHVRACLVVC